MKTIRFQVVVACVCLIYGVVLGRMTEGLWYRIAGDIALFVLAAAVAIRAALLLRTVKKDDQHPKGDQ